ncbi:MAG: cache domain-containing protein, partial [Desulfobacterales bacterium]
MDFKTKRFPFYIGITTLVVVIVATLSGLFLWISHRESKAAAVQMADRLFSEINTKTLQRYRNALESVALIVGAAARMPGMASTPAEDGMGHPGIEVMLKALESYDFLFSTYCGYDDGSFIQIVAVRDKPELRHLFGAPAGTVCVLRTISADSTGALKQRWHFLDQNRQVVGERNDLDPDYDPRVRPWFISAQEGQTAFFTAPYIFSSSKLPGITCAEKLFYGGGVMGADITLERFATSLERQKISDHGTLFLFDRAGRIIAHPKENPVIAGPGQELRFLTGEASEDPRVRAVVGEYRTRTHDSLERTREMKIDGADYLVRCTPLNAGLKFDQILASTAPVADFTGHIRRMQQRVFLFSGLVLMV